MKYLSAIILAGFLALAAMVYFFNPTEPYYPEDETPTPIVAR
jgi:hypothetical protein